MPGGEVLWLQPYPDRLPAGDADEPETVAVARRRSSWPTWSRSSTSRRARGLTALLRDDVRCSMPPTPGLCVGRDMVVSDWVESGFVDLRGLRAVPTAVNRQPAVAFHLWRQAEGAYLPLTIDVLRVTGGAITEVVIFHDDQFPRLGLPERLPADGTSSNDGGTP
ncbi:hypothetical protein [Nonomuraea sp. NPDC049607]|uniref:hypothetical protein n=1 Tax=Nonomuraea sp. NPDC049607 TaxID=3154732 RepID=UPI00342500BE